MLHHIRRAVVPVALSGLLLMGFTPATADLTTPEPTPSESTAPSSPTSPAPAPSDDPSSSSEPSVEPATPSEAPTPSSDESANPQMMLRSTSPSSSRSSGPILVGRAPRIGDRSEEIQRLQDELIKHFPKETAGFVSSGVFDTTFERVVRQIQRKLGATPDGDLGPNSALKLRQKGIDYWVIAGIASQEAFSRGRSGADVRDLQLWLSYGFQKSHGALNADGDFGPSTQRYVKKLQRHFGLRQTGVVDYELSQELLIDGLNVVIQKPPVIGAMTMTDSLRPGARGALVKSLQRFLRYNFPQFGRLSTDGDMGPATTRAFKKFQRMHGAGADGVLGFTSTRILRSYGVDAWILSPVSSVKPIVQGHSGSDVMKAQTWLTYKFPVECPISTDGYFGPKTTQCVRGVQTSYGLVTNGQIDETLSKKLLGDGIKITIVPTPSPFKVMSQTSLKNGSSGRAVESLQRGLNKFFPEVPPLSMDGHFGAKTENAVKVFQRLKGLNPDGEIGPNSAAVLRDNGVPIWIIPMAYVTTPLKKGSRGADVFTAELGLTYLFPDVCSFKADRFFDAETDKCLRAAQKKMGIGIDGELGPNSAKHLQKKGIPLYFQGYFAPAGYLQPTDSITPLGWSTNTLTYGMNGVKVRIAQRKLGIWGTMTLASVDGRMQNAVRNFQRRAGIYADGVVGATTWAKLGTGYSWYVDQYQASPIGIEATRSERIEAMINYAMAQRGSSYTWGGAGYYSLGYDCSGLALQSLYAAGLDPQPINVIKHAWPQYRSSQELYKHPKLKHYPLSQRQRGDLIFYKSGGTVIHVAIYLGNNQVVHTDYMGRPARVQHFLLNFGWSGTASDVVRPFP